MALIRGVGSLAPCPRCLVKEENLSDPCLHSPPRTSHAMQAIITRANQETLTGSKEEILKHAGLRDVDVEVYLS